MFMRLKGNERERERQRDKYENYIKFNSGKENFIGDKETSDRKTDRERPDPSVFTFIYFFHCGSVDFSP